MNNKITRRYQLDVRHIKTIDDVKKILDAMQIRIDTDDFLYEELKDYFTVEVVPVGYDLLIEKIGWEKISRMTYEEMETEINKISGNEK